MRKITFHFLALCLLAGLALQLFFVFKVLAMRWIDPQSTAFERSEIWQIAKSGSQPFIWKQRWMAYQDISEHIKRAVIASEDSEFADHDGVQWDALEKAWQRNSKAEQIAQRRSKKTGQTISAKIVGGSTITQQLAKNLFLSGERSFLRKGQEFIIVLALEAFLSKERILEIYLNSVELGRGVFGVDAAAWHYYGKSAAQLSAYEAARLAVMLPRPQFFEKALHSPYLASRAQTVMARMAQAQLP